MVVLIRANDFQTDPRAQKYIDFYKKKEIKYLLIGWNRDNKKINLENSVLFSRKEGYNQGIKAIKGRLLFCIFIFKVLFKNIKKIDIIHACDFDTIMPSVIISKIFKKKVIFDIFDWFSDTIITNNTIIDFSIRFLEKLSVKNSTHVFLCEEERKKQIKVDHPSIFILPNIPFVSDTYPKKQSENKNKIIISYVGGFYKDRNIDILLYTIASNPSIELHIAGYGDNEITEMCEKFSKNYNNIKYFGKVKYDDGLKIMYNSDVIYAMYCKSNKNHIFAAPNKYYESLFLGIPLITTNGTIVGEKVIKNRTGYVIDEQLEDTKELLFKIKKDDLYILGKNCKCLWDKNYYNYVESFLNHKYLKLINN